MMMIFSFSSIFSFFLLFSIFDISSSSFAFFFISFFHYLHIFILFIDIICCLIIFDFLSLFFLFDDFLSLIIFFATLFWLCFHIYHFFLHYVMPFISSFRYFFVYVSAFITLPSFIISLFLRWDIIFATPAFWFLPMPIFFHWCRLLILLMLMPDYFFVYIRLMLPSLIAIFRRLIITRAAWCWCYFRLMPRGVRACFWCAERSVRGACRCLTFMPDVFLPLTQAREVCVVGVRVTRARAYERSGAELCRKSRAPDYADFHADAWCRCPMRAQRAPFSLMLITPCWCCACVLMPTPDLWWLRCCLIFFRFRYIMPRSARRRKDACCRRLIIDYYISLFIFADADAIDISLMPPFANIYLYYWCWLFRCWAIDAAAPSLRRCHDIAWLLSLMSFFHFATYDAAIFFPPFFHYFDDFHLLLPIFSFRPDWWYASLNIFAAILPPLLGFLLRLRFLRRCFDAFSFFGFFHYVIFFFFHHFRRFIIFSNNIYYFIIVIFFLSLAFFLSLFSYFPFIIFFQSFSSSSLRRDIDTILLFHAFQLMLPLFHFRFHYYAAFLFHVAIWLLSSIISMPLFRWCRDVIFHYFDADAIIIIFHAAADSHFWCWLLIFHYARKARARKSRFSLFFARRLLSFHFDDYFLMLHFHYFSSIDFAFSDYFFSSSFLIISFFSITSSLFSLFRSIFIISADIDVPIFRSPWCLMRLPCVRAAAFSRVRRAAAKMMRSARYARKRKMRECFCACSSAQRCGCPFCCSRYFIDAARLYVY